jgi:uncharacterized protein
MSLKATITEDMKNAMRAKESQKLGAIRMLLAALKQKEIDERIELTDADVLTIIDKEIKKRRDSIAQYKTANRADLVAIEEFEVGVLTAYMPQQLSEAEVAVEVEQAIAATGAQGAKDMGKVMAALKAKLAGRADMTKVSGLVKAKLAG